MTDSFEKWLTHTHKPIPGRQSQTVDQTAEAAQHHFTDPQSITCPRCGADDTYKYGTRRDNQTQVYMCKVCRHTFDLRGVTSGRQKTAAQIAGAINDFYRGLSFPDIGAKLGVHSSTAYRWVISYTQDAVRLLDNVKVDTSGVWVADEMFININKKRYYHWDCIDAETRFLLAGNITSERSSLAASQLFVEAMRHSKTPPDVVLTDKLRSYGPAIKAVFENSARHIQTGPFNSDVNTNRIERWHSTLRERTKVFWGLKQIASARTLLGGFILDYNFIRPHMSLNGQTPASAAGYTGPITSWLDIVNWRSVSPER